MFRETHKVLGVLCALPLSVNILGRELMLLHVFAFLPLALWMLWRHRARVLGSPRKLTPVDRMALVYFAWAAASLVVNALGLHADAASQGVQRLFSTAATVMYWVLPFIIGRFIFQTDQELKDFLDGLVLGATVTCVIMLAGYAYTWVSDRLMVRYAIGQRTVLVLTFISLLVIFIVPLRVKGYLLAFLLWTAVALSATRASLAQWIIALAPALLFAKNFSGTQRATLAALALSAAFISSLFGDTVLRIAWLSDISLTMEEGEGLKLRTRDDSSNIRLQVWALLSAKAFQDLPTAIFGFGQLGPSFLADAFDYKGQRIQMFSAHSEYLDQIIRAGTVGLAIFLCLLLTVLVQSFHLRRYPAPLGLAFYGLGFALVGVAAYSIVHESVRYPWFGVIFWVLAGALSSVVARSRNNAAAQLVSPS